MAAEPALDLWCPQPHAPRSSWPVGSRTPVVAEESLDPKVITNLLEFIVACALRFLTQRRHLPTWDDSRFCLRKLLEVRPVQREVRKQRVRHFGRGVVCGGL